MRAAETDKAKELTPRQHEAIIALLTHQTIEEAAKACGSSVASLHRWLKEDEFKNAVRNARLRVLDMATMNLRNAAADAVETLKRNLYCGVPAAEIRAAGLILDMSYKSAELEDLAARIEGLEEFLKPEQRRAAV